MRASQFETLERDLADALSQVKPAKLSQRRGFVDMVLEEYDNLDKGTKVNLNPVSYLNRQLSEHTYLDLSLFNLIIAEILTNRIRLNNEESNSDLVNSGINAINYWKTNRDKHELGKKRNAREIETRNKKAVKRMNLAKYEPLNKLVARIFELYEPTIESLRNDGKAITYLNIARRIAPIVRSQNEVDKEKKIYLLGNADDQIGAIKSRLEKAVRAGDLRSTRDYKK